LLTSSKGIKDGVYLLSRGSSVNDRRSQAIGRSELKSFDDVSKEQNVAPQHSKSRRARNEAAAEFSVTLFIGF
jgi:hypothetical protein